jgi:hypothetical protein
MQQNVSLLAQNPFPIACPIDQTGREGASADCMNVIHILMIVILRL